MFTELLMHYADSSQNRVDESFIHDGDYIKVRALNPFCGDKACMWVETEFKPTSGGNFIDPVRIKFWATGCVISRACAVLSVWVSSGQSVAESKRRLESMRAVILGIKSLDSIDFPSEQAELLSLLNNVHQYPMRIKCATLFLHALERVFKTELIDKEQIELDFEDEVQE